MPLLAPVIHFSDFLTLISYILYYAKNKYLSLALILIITFLAPAIGSYTTTSFKEPWYSEIILPSFNPQVGYLVQYGQLYIF